MSWKYPEALTQLKSSTTLVARESFVIHVHLASSLDNQLSFHRAEVDRQVGIEYSRQNWEQSTGPSQNHFQTVSKKMVNAVTLVARRFDELWCATGSTLGPVIITG